MLDYEPNTGLFRWKRKPCSWVNIGDIAGTFGTRRYVKLTVNQHNYEAHRVVWYFMTGNFPANLIDHIDGNKHNNRWENLREATKTQNAQNIKKPLSSNTTGFLGVSRKRNKFSARIRTNGVYKSLGSFNTPEEASVAYLQAKRLYHSHGTL